MDKYYAVLGLPVGASAAEVRARYIELARSCHPDKLVNESDAVRKEKEEYFKEVTVAYHKLQGGSSASESDEINWKDILNSFASNTEFWGIMKDLVKKAKDAAERVNNSNTAEIHVVKVPVTLEEVHTNRVKKLRLFLSGLKEPVFVNVACGQSFPEVHVYPESKSGVKVATKIVYVVRDHATFRYDTILGSMDLYTDVYITLKEYITGKTKMLQYLDGSDIIVDVPECPDLELPIQMKGYGLQRKGDLYVSLHVTLPKKDQMEGAVRENLINALDALTSTCV